MTEAIITIGGRQLTQAQAMAVRVAITSFHADMKDPNALGDDEHGRRMAEGYRDRLTEVLEIDRAARPARSPRMAIDEDRPERAVVVTSAQTTQRADRILQLAGFVPEQATQQQRELATAYAMRQMPVDEAAVRLQRALEERK